MGNLSLFEPARSPLAERLEQLAAEGVYFGTSSWKYEGWLGQVYTAERYFTRGRFSQKKFEAECLREYAETFPAVCGDFSFYQFPTDSYWLKLFSAAPEKLKFAFKAPEMVTVRKWPSHARYGARGGQENETYLDAGLFERAFLRPIERWREQVAVVIFEFGTFAKAQYEGVGAFAEDLEKFLKQLPGGFRYSVEVRNREYLDAPYFDVLRAHNVAHTFSSWTRMPELKEQVEHSDAYTADFHVARALLRPGRAYEQAVQKFQPYREIQEPNPGARDALKVLMEVARRKKQLAFLFVNNRLEGNAPGTIQAVTSDD
jgi:uncharacterized protein YecE (DUF72 family)